MTTSKSISLDAFKDALSRYPQTIKKFSDAEKSLPTTLEQLDQFRYIDAPARFSKQTGNVLKAGDIQKLTEWKLRHGKYRPSLSKLVASNTDETIAAATSAAFKHYASNSTDISGTLKLLSEPLKGVGPATASLYLSIHDPTKVIFFSDEAFKWLVGDQKLKYDLKEYEALHKAAKDFVAKLSVTPIELEKVAFVLIKESEPVKEKAAPPVPSGRGRGRPPKPDSERVSRPVSGRGRGRPPKASTTKPVKKTKAAAAPSSSAGANGSASAKKRGRPAANKDAEASESPAPVAGKKRGRPSGSKNEQSAKKQKS